MVPQGVKDLKQGEKDLMQGVKDLAMRFPRQLWPVVVRLHGRQSGNVDGRQATWMGGVNCSQIAFGHMRQTIRSSTGHRHRQVVWT